MGISSRSTRHSGVWTAAALILAWAARSGAVDYKVQSDVFKRPVNFLENGNVYAHGRVFTGLPWWELPTYYGSFRIPDADGRQTAVIADNHIFLTGTYYQNQSSFPGNVKIRRADGTEIASFGTDGNLYIDNSLQTNANCVAPVYEPTKWNTNDDIQFNDNCYNYANNQLTYTYAQPGRASGGAVIGPYTVDEVKTAAMNDQLSWVGWNFPGNDYTCTGSGTLLFLTVDIDAQSDYHWYRLDKAAGRWSHKIGGGEASDKDASNNTITNPLTANRNYGQYNYTENGGFYCTCGSDAYVR